MKWYRNGFHITNTLWGEFSYQWFSLTMSQWCGVLVLSWLLASTICWINKIQVQLGLVITRSMISWYFIQCSFCKCKEQIRPDLTTETLYLTFTNELMGGIHVSCEYHGENWPCYGRTVPFISFPLLFQALVQATLDIYGAIREQLKPTPSTPQYMFSLHDLAKVVEGMLLMSPRSKIKVAPKLKKPPKKSMQSKYSFLPMALCKTVISLLPSLWRYHYLVQSPRGLVSPLFKSAWWCLVK